MMRDRQILESIDAGLLELIEALKPCKKIPLDIVLQVADLVQQVRTIMAGIEENHLARWN